MEYSIRQMTDRAEKAAAIDACDSAYTISVKGRPFYPELFEKLDKKAIMFGVYADGNIAGYSAFYANDMENRKAFLTLFCIRKDLQRKYLGTALMQASIEKARECGMQAMELEVLKRDAGAIAFYQKMGFVEKRFSEGSFLQMRRRI